MTTRNIFMVFILLISGFPLAASNFVGFCPQNDNDGSLEKIYLNLQKNNKADKLINSYYLFNKARFKSNKMRYQRSFKVMERSESKKLKSNVINEFLSVIHQVEGTLGNIPGASSLYAKAQAKLAGYYWENNQPEKALMLARSSRLIAPDFKSYLKELNYTSLENKMNQETELFKSSVQLELSEAAHVFINNHYAGFFKTKDFTELPEGFYFVNIFKQDYKLKQISFELGGQQELKKKIRLLKLSNNKLAKKVCDILTKTDKTVLNEKLYELAKASKAKTLILLSSLEPEGKKALLFNSFSKTNKEIKLLNKDEEKAFFNSAKLSFSDLNKNAFKEYIESYKQLSEELKKKDEIKNLADQMGDDESLQFDFMSSPETTENADKKSEETKPEEKKAPAEKKAETLNDEALFELDKKDLLPAQDQ